MDAKGISQWIFCCNRSGSGVARDLPPPDRPARPRFRVGPRESEADQLPKRQENAKIYEGIVVLSSPHFSISLGELGVLAVR